MALSRTFFVGLLLSFLASSILAEAVELRVTGDRVNLRALPDGNSERLGSVSKEDTLISPVGIEEGKEWVEIEPPENAKIWIFSELLRGSTVITDKSQLRSGPGTAYRPVGQLSKGDIVEKLESKGDWTAIKPVKGKCRCYISAQFVEVIVPPPPLPPLELPMEEPEPPVEAKEPPAVVAEVLPPPPSPPEPPKVPSVLNGYGLVVGCNQGEMRTVSGTLRRVSLSTAPSFTIYALYENMGGSSPKVVCYVIGLRGQWEELVGSDLEISGRSWVLSGYKYPIVDANEVRRRSSPLE